MQSPHVIRLRGPWQYEACHDPNSSQCFPNISGQSQLLEDWAPLFGSKFHGRIHLERFFHRPTGLQPNQSVYLVTSGVYADGLIQLNGQSVGDVHIGDPTKRFEISSGLQSRNQVSLQFTVSRNRAQGQKSALADAPLRLIAHVQLEI